MFGNHRKLLNIIDVKVLRFGIKKKKILPKPAQKSRMSAKLAITEPHSVERLLEEPNAYTAGVMKKWRFRHGKPQLQQKELKRYR